MTAWFELAHVGAQARLIVLIGLTFVLSLKFNFPASRYVVARYILDEPTNNLGVEETHCVLRFIKEVREAAFPGS